MIHIDDIKLGAWKSELGDISNISGYLNKVIALGPKNYYYRGRIVKKDKIQARRSET